MTLADGTLSATDGGKHLCVETHVEYGTASYPAPAAGLPLCDCPDCDGTLVHADGAVRCLGCDAQYGIPRDTTVLSEKRCDCGRPRMRITRGRTLEVCIDRNCESLDKRVRDALDREWDCPDCGNDPRVLRRGGLIAGCERYPDCDTGWGIPTGTVDGRCDCGLPVFETGSGRRYLDTECGE